MLIATISANMLTAQTTFPALKQVSQETQALYASVRPSVARVQRTVLVFDAAGPKPLAFRQREQEVLQGLRVAGEIPVYPLIAQYLEREFGVAAWFRTNGAVGYFASATYADPTITAP